MRFTASTPLICLHSGFLAFSLPWLAFYRRDTANRIEERLGVGILVARYITVSLRRTIVFPYDFLALLLAYEEG
ncbi:hypothetical protein C5167_035175 [Papaver somniferum]|uniref:Uncharacterized protein n=1 Tax=Papaver somniferum TaxID=3469 RepID=A0A4Y7KJ55_PAPSO|nr:hypothetical protein C5167_035175 [Papaver somniferum]